MENRWKNMCPVEGGRSCQVELPPNKEKKRRQIGRERDSRRIKQTEEAQDFK